MENYKPISCSFVDIIEHYAVLKEEVRLKYVKADSVIERQAVIKTWHNDGQAEYLKIVGSDENIRLDRIVSINDHILKDHC